MPMLIFEQFVLPFANQLLGYSLVLDTLVLVKPLSHEHGLISVDISAKKLNYIT